MATLREIQKRIKAVTSIAKVTKSMKMIASTKLTNVQRGMEAARDYGQASQAILVHADVPLAATNLDSLRSLAIVVSGDRGLSGGIHSNVSKATKGHLALNSDSRLVVIGDKARNQLQRVHRDSIELSFNQLGRQIPSYGTSLAITDAILSEIGVDNFDIARIIYNKFINVIRYEAQHIDSPSQAIMQSGSKFVVYEATADKISKYREFLLANAIHWCLVEAHAVEITSKRNAMENATKNANDMIATLTLKYNRGRQAAITTELIDVITGAASV
ncbi:ATP synthase F1, gamma subunit [Ramicandelaber brevisporus]|nr:ATP synthase F1, gamma subunit [Ramicandelaber brevisporus]